jgi:hypothetical protein
VARRRVNDDLVSGVSDDGVGQPEIENRDVVAAKSIVTVVARRDREKIARERSGEDHHGIESLSCSLLPASDPASATSSDDFGRTRHPARVLARGNVVMCGYVWLSETIDVLCVAARVARQVETANIQGESQ